MYVVKAILDSKDKYSLCISHASNKVFIESIVF